MMYMFVMAVMFVGVMAILKFAMKHLFLVIVLAVLVFCFINYGSYLFPGPAVYENITNIIAGI